MQKLCGFSYISTTIHTNVTENIKLNQENANSQNRSIKTEEI